MARIDREALRTQVLLAFARHKINVKHLEIIADSHDGRWRIGPAMIPSPMDPAIKVIAEEIEAELSLLYELDGMG
jgi:hypothetical protein